MKVEELMTRAVATVAPEDGLDRAARWMRELDCGCVPVVDRRSQSLVGIVTDRDACMTALRSDRPLSRLRVDEAMASWVFTCRPGDPIREAERLMGLHQVRRLPVVDGKGRLVGLLSLDDVAREARHECGLIAPTVSAEEVGTTLGQVGRPRLIGGLEGGAPSRGA